jgi:L-ribulose-5-phosphate 3-epimerase UlaE
MDTKYMLFGPDVGQLAKGGSDPVKVVKDFLPLIRHVHLKDWDRGPNWQQYCPLGKGKVDIPSIMDLLEKSEKNENHHGGVGLEPWRCADTFRSGEDQQRIFADVGLYIPCVRTTSEVPALIGGVYFSLTS